MQKILARQVQQRYPLTVLDLPKNQLKLLIDILSIQNSNDFQKIYYISAKCIENFNEMIQRAIRDLPSNLRSNFMVQIVPNTIIRAATLCLTHKGLNPYVINHTFRLVKGEVTSQLNILDWYSDRLDKECKALVRALQAIEGMWWEPSTKNPMPPIGASRFQENRCEACILARIVIEPMHLQNLRTTLLSRTRTRKKHRAPKLLSFIDAGICNFPTAFQIFTDSSERAFKLKTARKSATKERKRKGKENRPTAPPRDGDGNRSEEIIVYLDPGEMHPESLCTPPTCERFHDEILYPCGPPNTADSQDKGRCSKLPGRPIEGELVPAMAYTPPREEPDWKSLVPERSDMDAVIKRIDALLGEMFPSSKANRDNDEMRYRRNLLQRQLEAFSDPECDSDEWEDDWISEANPGEASWSLKGAPGQKPEIHYSNEGRKPRML